LPSSEDLSGVGLGHLAIRAASPAS